MGLESTIYCLTIVRAFQYIGRHDSLLREMPQEEVGKKQLSVWHSETKVCDPISLLWI